MKYSLILLIAILISGCSKQADEPSDEKAQEPSAGKQAVDRMTGQTAVKAYKHTKDVLVDVEKSTQPRTQSVKDLNKE